MTHPLLGFADIIRSGRPTFTAWIGMTDPFLPDLLAREDFDSITFDMQHGMHDTTSVARGISIAALAGKPSVVRIPVDDFSFASRALDFGAMGIIAPMINSVADARKLVEFTKYPPLGSRSWGPVRAIPLTGLSSEENLAQANRHTLTIAMIETRPALNALDDILAIDGIDGVFVGPSDLSIALFNGSRVDANAKEIDDAMLHVLTRAKAHGKFASAFALSGERAGHFAKMGFSFLTLCTDALLIQTGVRDHLAKARGALRTTGTAGY